MGFRVWLPALVAIAAAVSLKNALPVLERDLALNANLNYTAETIVERVPAGSVLFGDQRMGMQGLLNYIQWRGDYELYPADAFSDRGMRWRGDPNPDQPHPLQPARRRYLKDYVYRDRSSADLQMEQGRIIRAALGQGRRVFVVQPSDWLAAFRTVFRPGAEFIVRPVVRWKEPVQIPQVAGTPLAPPLRGFGQNRQAQAWQILKIVPKQGPPARSDAPPATTTTAPVSGR